jgi:hypothetical protein
MATPKRPSPKPRHVRQPARCCLIRIKNNGKRVGAVGQLDPTGIIVSSSLASDTGDPAHYWPRLRASLPASAIVTASTVPRYLDIDAIDFEASIFRRVLSNGRIARFSARGRREMLTLRAKLTAANRAAIRARGRRERSGLHWAHGAKRAQTSAAA